MDSFLGLPTPGPCGLFSFSVFMPPSEHVTGRLPPLYPARHCLPVGAAPQKPGSCQLSSLAAQAVCFSRMLPPLQTCSPSPTPPPASSHSITLLWLFNFTKFTFLESDIIGQPWGLSLLLSELDPSCLGTSSQVPLRFGCSCPVSEMQREVGRVPFLCPGAPSLALRSWPLYAGVIPVYLGLLPSSCRGSLSLPKVQNHRIRFLQS